MADNAIPLRELNPSVRHALTGRSFSLPKAKGASEPYYYGGSGQPPVPHGTKISVWYLNTQNPLNGSWWIGCTSNQSTWKEPCVFRVRGNGERRDAGVEGVETMAQAVGRVADALTRIASAIEAHREAISEPDGGPDA